jgi:hypothetical protein
VNYADYYAILAALCTVLVGAVFVTLAQRL